MLGSFRPALVAWSCRPSRRRGWPRRAADYARDRSGL